MTNLQPVRGTKDLLPEDYKAYQYIVNIAQKLGECYSYKAMTTPIFEFTGVFSRTLGETSDVVSKEMYSFLDKGGESITLRPEFTAAIARALISNSLFHELPIKFFSHGPLFRYERPQKGRYRQLHQINFEYFGSDSPFADSETIALAAGILGKLGILKDIKLELNSLGDKESRIAYHESLVKYFKSYENKLSEDSKIRLYKNPLRILDSKDLSDREIIKNAPICSEYYNEYTKDYFQKVRENLDSLEISYHINSYLVRGLDYYSHTAFEFTTDKLGAQGTVLGGGRYDGLLEIMANKKVPAIGFAAGIERLSSLIEYVDDQKNRPIIVIAASEELQQKAFMITQELRSKDFVAELSYGKDIAKKLKFANKINAKFAVFVGEDELKLDNVKLKDLDNRVEKLVKIREIEKNLVNFSIS